MASRNVFGVLGFATGMGAGFFAAQWSSKQKAASESVKAAKDASGALKYGAPTEEYLKIRDGYAVAYDRRMRTARWVAERLSKDELYPEPVKGKKRVHRNECRFEEDLSVPEPFRARLADYRGSGYDRGHLSPAADHKTSQARMCQSFLLSNIAPQVGKGYNRDYWARLEAFVRNLTKEYDDVYVITGPAWVPVTDPESGKHYVSYEVIGSPPNVAVPTHFYKAVLAENADASARFVGAFLTPNTPIPDDTPLTTFSVPLNHLESIAGIKMFPAAAIADADAAASKPIPEIVPLCDASACVLPPPWSPPTKSKPSPKPKPSPSPKPATSS